MESFIISKIEEIAFSKVNAQQELWTSKILDSISIVELIVELETEYGIKVPFNEITEDHFETVERMVTYLKTKI